MPEHHKGVQYHLETLQRGMWKMDASLADKLKTAAYSYQRLSRCSVWHSVRNGLFAYEQLLCWCSSASLWDNKLRG